MTEQKLAEEQVAYLFALHTQAQREAAIKNNVFIVKMIITDGTI